MTSSGDVREHHSLRLMTPVRSTKLARERVGRIERSRGFWLAFGRD